MAWLGVVAILGLVVCGIGEVFDFRRSRRERRLPPGESLPPSWWSGRRIVFFSVGGIALIVIIVVAVTQLFPSSNNANITANSTPTTAPTATGRPVGQVRVEVLNGSGVTNAATRTAAALHTAGYPIAGTGNAPVRRGAVVECKPGFDVEAVVLARAVGAGTAVQPFPNPAPLGSATASCVVVLGR